MPDDTTVKPIEVLRPGRFTAMDGQVVAFAAGDIADIAAVYDPKLYEAPLVVGHPKTDDPAYGWAISFAAEADGVLTCTPGQVDPAFAAIVEQGRYKRVSLALFPPKHAANPKPGHWYPKHIGFLGAAAPAVQGLKPAQLAGDDDAVVIELAAPRSWVFRRMANLFGGIRDYLVEKEGAEKADQLMPSYAIGDVRDAAAELEAEEGNTPSLASPTEEETMPDKEKDAAARAAKLDEREAALVAREVAFAATTTAARTKDDEVFVDALVKDLKVRPTQRGEVLALMASLDDGSATVELAAGGDGKATKVSPREAYRRQLAAAAPLVAKGEIVVGADAATVEFAAPQGAAVDPDGLALHGRATEYMRAHPGTGYMAAVKAVGGK